jgi:hypothetical protein
MADYFLNLEGIFFKSSLVVFSGYWQASQAGAIHLE